MSGATRGFFGAALLALGAASTLHLLMLLGSSAVWAALLHLTIFGWITGMIFAVSYHTMPHFAARNWPFPRLSHGHLSAFVAGVALATLALLQGAPAWLAGALMIQALGAVLFVAHIILMFTRGTARATPAPMAPTPGQRAVDRVGTRATKLAALSLPIALLLLAATAWGSLDNTWWLAAEHLALLGWVMLMIAGVGYHVLPRFSGQPLRGVAWARAQLLFHAGAVLLMVPALGFGWRGVFIAGALLMSVALALFVYTVQPAVQALRPRLLTIAFNPVEEISP